MIIIAHILSINSVPGSMLNTSHALTHMILSTTQWGSLYNSPHMEVISHFVNEEGEGSNYLSLAPLVISGRT